MARSPETGSPARRKRLGQHFLVNTRAADRIVTLFEPRADDQVLEIGPGAGVLTERLLPRVGRLVAVEIDPKLAAELEHRFADEERLDILQADILSLPAATLQEHLPPDRGRVRVCSNLPYSTATAIITRLLEAPALFTDLLVMVQKEVADRITAAPGGKEYGSLTIAVQSRCDTESVMTLAPGSFKPPPKVHSSVVRLTVRPQPLIGAEDLAGFLRFVRTSFSRRRKVLLNSLAGTYGVEKGECRELFATVGIPERARPEELSPERFAQLYRAFIT